MSPYPLLRLHQDEHESVSILLRPELEYAIVDGDQDLYQELYVHGMQCLAAWYVGQAASVIHVRHQNYLENPFRGESFTPPWWWKHPLYIENCRAILLDRAWTSYKDHHYFVNYLKPNKVPFIQPAGKPDLWTFQDQIIVSDPELWLKQGWIAEKEDRKTRENKLYGRIK